MTTRVRMLLLACTGVMGLMLAGSALAAFTPTIAIRHTPPTAQLERRNVDPCRRPA